MEGLDNNTFDRPLLDEYRNAVGFPSDQKVLDYRTAHRVVSCIVQSIYVSRLTRDSVVQDSKGACPNFGNDAVYCSP